MKRNARRRWRSSRSPSPFFLFFIEYSLAGPPGFEPGTTDLPLPRCRGIEGQCYIQLSHGPERSAITVTRFKGLWYDRCTTVGKEERLDGAGPLRGPGKRY